jgi:hypothetical protein
MQYVDTMEDIVKGNFNNKLEEIRIMSGNMITNEFIMLKEMIYNSRMDECHGNILAILGSLDLLNR